jgi:hypothetical protein
MFGRSPGSRGLSCSNFPAPKTQGLHAVQDFFESFIVEIPAALDAAMMAQNLPVGLFGQFKLAPRYVDQFNFCALIMKNAAHSQ